MNGRYLIVTRMAAVLVTASLFLIGCERGEARDDDRLRPSAEVPAPAPGQLAVDGEVDVTGGAMPEPGEERSAAPAVDEPGATPAGDASAPAGDRAPPAERTSGNDTPVSRASSPTSSTSPVRTAGESRSAVATAEPAATAAATRSGSPDEILRATSRAYEGLRSFRAGFEQTLQNTIMGRTTTSSGTLYQRQPDRFLMEFSDPPEDVIVSDGEFFWMYFPSVDRKQVIRTPRGGQGLDLRAQFIGDPVRRFETTYQGTDTVRGRKAHVMTLVPRESLGYERLKVWIDADDHLVRRFALTEGNGLIRHLELRDMVRNPTLPDDLFAFTPPQGTQVVTR